MVNLKVASARSVGPYTCTSPGFAVAPPLFTSSTMGGMAALSMELSALTWLAVRPLTWSVESPATWVSASALRSAVVSPATCVAVMAPSWVELKAAKLVEVSRLIKESAYDIVLCPMRGARLAGLQADLVCSTEPVQASNSDGRPAAMSRCRDAVPSSG